MKPLIFYKMISQYNIVYHKQAKNILLLSVAVMVNVALNFLMDAFNLDK